MAEKDTADLKVTIAEELMEMVGPSGSPLHVRVHETSRQKEPSCRDRLLLELQYKEADKKRWNKVAFVHGRDSYEDEYRYVLEETEVQAVALSKLLTLLGSEATAKQLVQIVGEATENYDQGQVLAILVERWDSRYEV